MADNSDAQKISPAQHWIVRGRRTLWWVCVAALLGSLLLCGSWLAHQWQAFHQSPMGDLLVGPTFVVLALVGLVVLWKGPQWQVAHVAGLDPKERFDRENEARKTLATILGGILLLTGGFFTWRNIKVAQESLRVSQESLRVSQEGQITDRFTKAIEQLGAVNAKGGKKIVVRLGGIYALERIANESERDHWPVMEVLCAYVRNVAPIKPWQSTGNTQASQKSAPADVHPEADVQAILTVLGRRNRRYETKNQSLDLSQSDLLGANLTGDLAGADLGRTNLRRAELSGANLRGAYVLGADLEGADLTDAHLEGADLTGAHLDGANLKLADLEGADLTDAHLSDTRLASANLSGADLGGADLSGVHDLTRAQIDEAKGDSNTKLPQDLRMPESWKE